MESRVSVNANLAQVRKIQYLKSNQIMEIITCNKQWFALIVRIDSRKLHACSLHCYFAASNNSFISVADFYHCDCFRCNWNCNARQQLQRVDVHYYRISGTLESTLNQCDNLITHRLIVQTIIIQTRPKTHCREYPCGIHWMKGENRKKPKIARK